MKAPVAHSPATMKQVIMALFHSATNAHILHLQTKSYAEHVALGAYYEGIVAPVDTLVETMQGKGDIIRGYPLENSEFNESMTPLNYITKIRDMFVQNRSSFPSDSNIQNTLDTIMDLIESTLYKLRFLH